MCPVPNGDLPHRVEPCRDDVYRFVARRVADPADAADIAQQTLFLACSKIHTCRGENILPWLFTIAQRVVIDYYRARKRVQSLEIGPAALAEREPALRTLPDADLPVCACGEGLRGWLECIASRLSLEEQVAVLMADMYGYRDKESAARLGMSVPSYKLLLHGARAQLHEGDGVACSLVERTVSLGYGGRIPGRSTRRLPVTCRLTRRTLTVLRAELLQALD